MRDVWSTQDFDETAAPTSIIGKAMAADDEHLLGAITKCIKKAAAKATAAIAEATPILGQLLPQVEAAVIGDTIDDKETRIRSKHTLLDNT